MLFAVEYKNTITDDEVPLMVLDMEPENVMLWLEDNIDGVNGIDELLLSDLEPMQSGAYVTYQLRRHQDEWKLIKIMPVLKNERS
jgi:hypothetical protein